MAGQPKLATDVSRYSYYHVPTHRTSFMDTETQELVQENIRLTRENNRLLKKLWRAEVFGFWSKVLFLAIMIGVPVFVYRYYLADYVQDMQNMYQEIRDGVTSFEGIQSQVSLGALLESLEKRKEEMTP